MSPPAEPLPHPVTGRLHASPVPAGDGWPGDLATPSTPVAHDPAGVVRLTEDIGDVDTLGAAMSVCRACPRLVQWREQVATEKRAAFRDQPYWGRPIVGWGDAAPAVVVVGLAPAANGGNRTGRIFTGDRSGDWLFASLHRVGLAVQARSEHAGDGQRLVGTRMVATVRCAPPGNQPTIAERDTCAPWLVKELSLVAGSVQAVVCLGSYGWDAVLRTLRALGYVVPRPKPKFGHGTEVVLAAADREPVVVLGCFHPSQQNTFTGKLTEPMLDAVLSRAAELGRGMAGSRP